MFAFQKPRLDSASLGLTDESEAGIARIIEEETEAQRAIERLKYPEPPNRLTGLLAVGSFSYADSLRWDVLLTMGQCALRCAKRAGLEVGALLEFALNRCRPQEPWALFWFAAALSAMKDSAIAELQAAAASKAAMEAKLLHQRIREGAKVGGVKSAQTRRKNQFTPPGNVLRDERDALIARGTEPRAVASVLAKRYGVTPAAIRAAYKRN